MTAFFAALAILAAGERGVAQEEAPLEERSIPDYDGRGEPPTTFGDVAIWVPRLVLAPLYLVSEYLVRRPLGWLLLQIEQGPAHFLIEVFDITKKSDFGVVPTAYFEFGFRANAGVYLFADGLGAPEHSLRLHAATGGIHYWKVTLIDRFRLDRHGTELGLRVHASNRRDYLFSGIGPDTTHDQASRYRSRRFSGSVQLEIPGHAEAPGMLASAGIRDRDFGRGQCCDDPALTDLVEQGEVSELPPGFTSGYTAWFQRLEGVFDSRGYVGDHGLRLHAYGEHAFDLGEPTARRWIAWGGTFGLYFPTIAHRRVIGLAFGAYFVDPLGDEEVPFSEQALLGGDGLLRGFREGRLHGRSAAVASLEYQWPIWIWLQGVMQVAAGNVFGHHLSGFEPELLRGSFAFGLRTAESSPDHAFELLVAFGSETVEQGFGLDTVRVLVGTSEGF